jgi:hypothetical protein
LIELKKERLLVIYSTENNVPTAVTGQAVEGCQVELSRIEISDELYYTLLLKLSELPANEMKI